MSTRIYLGGIPPGTTSEELAQRFKSFGEVQSVEIVPDKVYPPSAPGLDPIVYPRDFGYVSLVPTDEKNLQRAISVYNGSSWRGCTLRCKLAKPTTMALLAQEDAEEEELANEEVDYSMPFAKEGTTLRIRQPFNKQLVTVVLGGSDLKIEPLSKVTPTVDKSDLPTPDGDIDVHVKEAAPRRTFEEHLRDVAEKYGIPDRVPLVWEPPVSPRTAARQEQEAAVSLSLKADLASKKPGNAGKFSAVPPPNITSKQGQAAPQAQQQQPRLAKRPAPASGASLPPAAVPPAPQRRRIVEFLSKQDVQDLTARPAVDLSRFGSDSDDEGNNIIDSGPKVDGIKIPQFDGAADSDTTPSDTTSSGSGTSTTSTSSESGGKTSTSTSTSSESDDSSSDDSAKGKKRGVAGGKSISLDPGVAEATVSSSSSDSESEDGSSSDDSDSGDNKESSKEIEAMETSSSDSDTSEDSSENDEDVGGGNEAVEGSKLATQNGVGAAASAPPSWMVEYLPAGASFFRQTPLVQVEAAWRGGREASVREYKERRRQALRQAGKGVGGKRRKD